MLDSGAGDLLAREVLGIEGWCPLEGAIDIDVVDFLVNLLHANALGSVEGVNIVVVGDLVHLLSLFNYITSGQKLSLSINDDINSYPTTTAH